MIRFLGLKDQVYCDDEAMSFAFYDTGIDRILSFGGTEVFDSVEEFVEDYKSEKYDPETTRSINRFLTLIPKEYDLENRIGYYIEF